MSGSFICWASADVPPSFLQSRQVSALITLAGIVALIQKLDIEQCHDVTNDRCLLVRPQ